MRRFALRAPVRKNANATSAVGWNIRKHSTPPVMEQLQYQYEDGYLDMHVFSKAQNEFGNYVKECMAKEGVEWQGLETKTYQMLMDEREFDPPCGPRPDSPAWAYIYGNHLVDFKSMADNLPAEHEFKRNYFQSYVEVLTKKLRMHYPKMDWQAKYKKRMEEWKLPGMTAFEKCKAECLAQAVAQGGQEEYIELYRSNSHFNFGADDPFHYYMPKDNETKWLALQEFEWDSNTGANADKYMPTLTKLEAFLEPNLPSAQVKEGLKAIVSTAEGATLFSGAVPSVVAGAKNSAEVEKALKELVDKENTASLCLALIWSAAPQLFSQFFVAPGSVDSFIADNKGTVEKVNAAYKTMGSAAAALEKAVLNSCKNMETVCKEAGVDATGLTGFLARRGFVAAQEAALPTPEAHWLSAKMKGMAADLKPKSFLAAVNCSAMGAYANDPQTMARKVYDAISYGAHGNTLNMVAQASDAAGFEEALGDEIVSFLIENGRATEAKRAEILKVVDKKLAVGKEAAAFNEARKSLGEAWQTVKLDYALADLGSLEIQYKY